MKFKRMEYEQLCECGRYFNGFRHQHTCWYCIKEYLIRKGYIK